MCVSPLICLRLAISSPDLCVTTTHPCAHDIDLVDKNEGANIFFLRQCFSLHLAFLSLIHGKKYTLYLHFMPERMTTFRAIHELNQKRVIKKLVHPHLTTMFIKTNVTTKFWRDFQSCTEMDE